MLSSKTIADYVQTYMKKVVPDNVQKSKRDDNIHQYKRLNNMKYVCRIHS